MSINNIEIQDSNGNVYYPHTDASVVKFGNSDVGSALSEMANNKANNTDKSRTTTAQDVTGAINELNSNKANKSNVIPYTNLGSTATDLNTMVTTGLYKCISWTNYPSGHLDAQGLLYVEAYTTGWERQTFISPHYNMRWERTRSNSVWDTWKLVATTETVTPTLLNGWSNYTGFETIKAVKTGNKVTLSGVIASGTSGIVGLLPLGFRPTATVIAMVISNATLVRADIYVDGTISLGTGYNNFYVSLNGISFYV